MQAISAGTPSRTLRLGLAAGAASIGAVALSLLIGTAPASASDDHAGGPGGLVQQLGGAVAAVVETATDPVETVANGLGATIAPVEHVAETATAPIVEPAAPVVRPVVQAPAVAVEVVRDSVAPTTDALAPVLQPVAQAVDPVERVVDAVVVELVLQDAVAPVVAPVADTIDRVLDAAPVVDELLGEAPVAGIVDRVAGLDPDADLLPAVALTGVPAAEPGVSTPAPGAERDLASTPADLPEGADASAAGGSAAISAVGAFAADIAPWTAAVRVGAAAAAPADVSVAARPSDLDRDVTRGPLQAPGGVMPSAASGIAAGVASPLAVINDHRLPAVAAGRVGALESDRAPSSLAEEHTASPD